MIGLIFLAFALLASAISVNKFLLQWFTPFLFVGIRMLSSGIILLTYSMQNNRRFSWSYIKNDLITLLGISLFTTCIPTVLKAYALKNLISSKATFLGSLDPFVTSLYAYMLWNEKLTKQKIIGMLVGFMGMFTMLFSTTPTEEALRVWWIFSYPELAAIGSMALGRLGWLLVQSLLRKKRYSPPEINGITMFTSGLLAFSAAFLIEPVNMQIAAIPWNWKIISLLLYTVVVGNVIAYTMYAHFLKHYTATFISLTGFSVPIFVYFYGRVFLAEPLSWNFILSVAITFIGLLIFYQSELKKGQLFVKK